MGKITDAVAVQKAQKDNSIKGLVKSMEGEIAKALPSVITPERFTRMVLTALSSNDRLAKCEPKSFLGAMMNAAQLGVEPNTPLGMAYLIPYGNQVQFQLGYKGLIDLAYRSGEVESIQAQIVYENDEFNCEYGLEPKLSHKPAKGERGKPVSVYAMFKTKSGGYSFEVMSYDECIAHGKRFSKTFANGPWQTTPEEMCKKTVLKRVLKYAPLKSDFARQVTADESIKTNIAADMYEVNDEYTDIQVDEDGVVLDFVEDKA